MVETLRNDGAKLVIYREGPDWDGVATYAVGQFSCQSAEAGARLLRQAAVLAQNEGAKALIGPMDGDTWHSYRYVSKSDGRRPFLMEPDTKPEVGEAFEQAGFSPIGKYFSASVSTKGLAKADAMPSTDLRIEEWDGTDPEGLFTRVHALSSQAFSKNPFYKPIDLAEFLSMYMPFVPMMKRELLLFARDDRGELVGFLFGLPNYAEGPRPESVILKTYASLQKGAGHALSTRFYRAATELGYGTVIHALMHEDNLSALRSGADGAEVFRHYTLMGLHLDR